MENTRGDIQRKIVLEDDLPTKLRDIEVEVTESILHSLQQEV